jgi:hypothetical protein
VISVIVYGRNDTHGYNLHRRAALSLNCLAETLDAPGDEIVFVDYNTPDELPTFIEALADTLTDRCLGLLRVLRVPAALHKQRFASRTHLPAIEPVARNAAVRRAHPSNRWLLSTNTDMIFLPQSDQSLSELCEQLPDAFYGLPRFELPEWLWERLPRTDPRRAISQIRRLGPGLRLDEPTLNEWIRFDAPGDFQLILREDFIAIDGLDEEMLLGYHVDSNLNRRMLLHRGSIESLESQLAGYHCNHNRERTIYHGAARVENDAARFVFEIERADLPAQRESWGLVDAELEEVAIGDRSGESLASAVVSAIPSIEGPPTASDTERVPFELTYDSAHVLPFIVDLFAVSPPDTVVAYIGANPSLERMLADVVAELGFAGPLEVADPSDVSSVDRIADSADAFVVDLGVDASLVTSPPPTLNGYEPAPFPVRLDLVFSALERLVELERARLGRGDHPRPLMLVHSATVFWRSYILAHLDCSYTTVHSRVRRATVRPAPIFDHEVTTAALAHERRLVHWAARGGRGEGRLHLRPGEDLELAELDDYRGFGPGWSYPTEAGLWTQGSRSELALALEGLGEEPFLLAFSLASVCVGSETPLTVDLLLNGERGDSRTFGRDSADLTWHVELPADLVANGTVDVSLVVAEPLSPVAVGWSSDDERPLGVLVSGVGLASPRAEETAAALAAERQLERWVDRGEGQLHVRVGEELELAELEDYRGFGPGWLYAADGGIWTHGPRSELALALDGVGEEQLSVSFSVDNVCVGTDAPLTVDLLLDGTHVATRVFSGSNPILWQVELPADHRSDDTVDATVVIAEPRSPVEVGWSTDDDRPLGILIRAVALTVVDRSLEPEQVIDFAAGSGGDRLLGEGWWWEHEPTGVWTIAEEAFLIFELAAPSRGKFELVLEGTALVTPRHPELVVEVTADGRRLAEGTFRFPKARNRLQAPLPSAARGGRTVVGVRVRQPARPVDLGLSGDARLLGLHLHSLLVRRRSWPGNLLFAAGSTMAKLRRRLTRSAGTQSS